MITVVQVRNASALPFLREMFEAAYAEHPFMTATAALERTALGLDRGITLLAAHDETGRWRGFALLAEYEMPPICELQMIHVNGRGSAGVRKALFAAIRDWAAGQDVDAIYSAGYRSAGVHRRWIKPLGEAEPIGIVFRITVEPSEQAEPALQEAAE